MRSFSVGDSTFAGDTDVDVTSSGDCNTAPTISTAVRNELEQGTAVSAGTLYKVNDIYYGSTTPDLAPGDKVQMILNASDYIDVLTEEVTVECGANRVSALMSAYSDPTVEFKEDSTVLTDSASGGSANASSVVAGGSETYKMCLTGTDKKTTGDAVFVVEVGSTTNVSDVNIYSGSNDLEEVDVPSFYTTTLTSPFKKAFKVPEIVGAKEQCYDVTVVAKSGETISGAMYTSAYVGEPLVEDDGSFVSYAVEDSTGDSDYEATWDYDITLA
jgi:hypothetical protein